MHLLNQNNQLVPVFLVNRWVNFIYSVISIDSLIQDSNANWSNWKPKVSYFTSWAFLKFVHCYKLIVKIHRPFERTTEAGVQPEWNIFKTPEPLDLLRWNFSPMINISLGILNTPLCGFCAFANDTFWNVVRHFRPIFWHFKLTS